MTWYSHACPVCGGDLYNEALDTGSLSCFQCGRTYATREILARRVGSGRRQQMRTDYQPSPFLRVTVGAPIFSADYESLGMVKEIHAQAFKVGTGFLHRDYWLPSELVGEAAPDAAVVLTVNKSDLDAHKQDEESRQAA